MKLFFLIFLSIFFVKPSKKTRILDKSIDPSLYSQVDSYYNDLFKKIINTRDEIKEENNGSILNDEDLNAFKLIDELSEDLKEFKSKKKAISQNFTKNEKNNLNNSSNSSENITKNSSILGENNKTEQNNSNFLKNDTFFENNNSLFSFIIPNITINENSVDSYKNDSKNYSSATLDKNPLPNFLENNNNNEETTHIQNKPNKKISEESFFSDSSFFPVII